MKNIILPKNLDVTVAIVSIVPYNLNCEIVTLLSLYYIGTIFTCIRLLLNLTDRVR